MAFASLLLFFNTFQASFLFLTKSLHASALLSLKGGQSLSFLLLNGCSAGSLLLVETLSILFLFSAEALHSLLLLFLELGTAGVFLCLHLLFMEALLIGDLGTASIIICNTLLASLVFESEALLAFIFILFETALALKLFSLAAEALFFELGSTLLFGSFGSEGTSLGVFTLQAQPLSFFLFLAESVLTLNLLASQAKLLSVTFSLEPLSLLAFEPVKLCQLGLDLLLVLFSFAPQLLLLLFECFPAGSLISLVLFAISLTDGLKFSLASQMISLSLLSSIFLFFGKTLASSLKLLHSVEFFRLTQLLKTLLFFVSLSASLLSSGLGFLTKALSLCEFSATLSLGGLHLFALFLDLETKLLFLFFLFLDDGKIIIMLFFIFSDARLILAICLLVILCIDCCVVLVLTTAALVLVLALWLLIFVDCASQQIALLATKLPHKVLLWLVSLNSDLIDGILNLGLSIYVIFEASDHVFFGKFVLAIVLSNLIRR